MKSKPLQIVRHCQSNHDDSPVFSKLPTAEKGSGVQKKGM
jgi:hypothetical protein